MIANTPPAESIPLSLDELGTMRVGGTRITLDVVAAAWRDGATPEGIVESFPALSLADVYAVVTWMLRHPAELGAYLARRVADATELRDRLENLPESPVRIRLRARARGQAGS